jgi:tetratricopeptide (TPR) repeat protein
MKRIKRKQLKEDEFVSTINKIVTFAKKRSKELITAAVAVVCVIILIIAIKVLQAHAVKKESRLLADVFELSSQIRDDPDKITELENLAGNGKFSRVAYLELATYWIEQGDTEKAKSYLEKVPQSKKDLIYYQSRDLLGQIYIQNQEFDKAIELYTKIEEENPKSYTLDPILFHRAQAHEQKGEIEKALDLYRRVQDEFSQTLYGFDASQKVRELEEKK